MKKLGIFLLVCLFVSTMAYSAARAESQLGVDFPKREITLIVPSGAGGGTDIWGRKLGEFVKTELGVPVVIVNQGASAGAVGMAAGMRAKPDGYTVTLVHLNLSVIPHVQDVDDWFSYKSYDPLLLFNVDPGTVTVAAKSEWRTIEEFIAAAQKEPGKIAVSSAPQGGAYHFAGKILEKETKISLNLIPYGGAGPSITALLGGEVQSTLFSPGEVLAQVQAGNLRTLAVMSSKRVDNPAFVNTPTLMEKGYDIIAGSWRGMVVPVGTPEAIKQILHDAFKKAIEDPEIQKWANDNAFMIQYMGPEEFGEFMASEHELYGDLVEELGMGK